MTVASGVTDSDPQAGYRRDVCAFADERLPTASKAAFVHSVLEREIAHVRVLLDPIEKFALALDAPDKRSRHWHLRSNRSRPTDRPATGFSRMRVILTSQASARA